MWSLLSQLTILAYNAKLFEVYNMWKSDTISGGARWKEARYFGRLVTLDPNMCVYILIKVWVTTSHSVIISIFNRVLLCMTLCEAKVMN